MVQVMTYKPGLILQFLLECLYWFHLLLSIHVAKSVQAEEGQKDDDKESGLFGGGPSL